MRQRLRTRFPPHAFPVALAEPETWHAFEALRDWRETDTEALPRIREAFDPLEADLWAEADAIATQPGKHTAFAEDAWRRVWDATQRLTRYVAEVLEFQSCPRNIYGIGG